MITFWQWQTERKMSDTEFVQYARDIYGHDVPTFRQALYSLLRSIFRERIIRHAIPDILAANDMLNRRELLSSTTHNGVELFLDYERENNNQSLDFVGPSEPSDDEIDEYYPKGVPWEKYRNTMRAMREER